MFIGDLDVRFTQVSHKLVQTLAQVAASDSTAGVFDHLLGLLQHETEHILVDLFLDVIKIKVSFLAHGLVAVGVHNDGEVLVDQAKSENLPILLLTFVKELHSMSSKVDSTAPNQASLHYRRFTWSAVTDQNKTQLRLSIIS